MAHLHKVRDVRIPKEVTAGARGVRQTSNFGGVCEMLNKVCGYIEKTNKNRRLNLLPRLLYMLARDYVLGP